MAATLAGTLSIRQRCISLNNLTFFERMVANHASAFHRPPPNLPHPRLNTIKTRNLIVSMIAVSAIPASSAVITATDDFSSNNLSGGTNWANNWTGGTVQNSTLLDGPALFQVGNNPQQLSRRFIQQSNLLTPFTVSFDLAMTVGTAQGNYGFRVHMETQQPSVFSIAWKNDLSGGALTFLHGNNQSITVPGAAWNIATNLANVQSYTYNFRFDIVPQAGQNPGQFNGQYTGTVTRSDGLSYSTGVLNWNGSNLNAGNFDELVFFNSSSRTTTQITNVLVGDPVLIIPEPTLPLLVSLTSLLLLRRRRCKSKTTCCESAR